MVYFENRQSVFGVACDLSMSAAAQIVVDRVHKLWADTLGYQSTVVWKIHSRYGLKSYQPGLGSMRTVHWNDLEDGDARSR